MSFTLTEDQQSTLDSFVGFLAAPENKYMVIQGSAGCGKSTLIERLVTHLKQFEKMYALLLGDLVISEFQIALAATTNPAVAVLKDLTGLDACTLHSLLRLRPKKDYSTGSLEFVRNKDADLITNTLLIIDEGSMIDMSLLRHLDSATHKCKVVIIGDIYQLTSVGQTTCVMGDINAVRSNMNQVMRNAGVILETGAMYRSTVETGIFRPLPSNQPGLNQVNGPTFQKMIDKAFTDPNYTRTSAKILAYTNTTVLAYNAYIRQIKNYPAELQVGESVSTNKPILATGCHRTVDSLVKITAAGDSFIFGDTGITGRNMQIDGCYTAFLPDDLEQAIAYQKALANKKDWVQHFRIKEKWLDLRPAYASTVHKAQGSSYDQVFIDLSDIGQCRNPTEVARMLYVAISRSRNDVVLYGKLPKPYRG